MSILREKCEGLMKEEMTAIIDISFQTLIQLELWTILKGLYTIVNNLYINICRY